MSPRGDVYVYQPKKNGSVKVSYHASGQRHLQIPGEPRMFIRQLTAPAWLQREERLWSKSFENFARLLPARAVTDGMEIEVALPKEEPGGVVWLGQVAIGSPSQQQGQTPGLKTTVVFQLALPMPEVGPRAPFLLFRMVRIDGAPGQAEP